MADLLPEGILKTFDPELKRAFDFKDKDVKQELKKAKNIRLYPDKFRVSGDGIFYTLQGEGPTMGQPAIFLRLHICNLRCVWCDAWYTWNPKTPQFWTESKLYTPEELAPLIRNAWGSKNPNKKKRLVFTGGEPLLQQKLILKLTEILFELDYDWTFEVETNGTIMPEPLISQSFQINCSPKLKNSENLEIARKKPQVLKAINEADNSNFKFVVMKPQDLDEIENEFVKAFNLDPDKIILMPQGVTPEEIRMNMRNVAEAAKIKGYRMLSRLQVEIWGAKRRV